MAKPKLLISHVARDNALAHALRQLLLSSTSITQDDIVTAPRTEMDAKGGNIFSQLKVRVQRDDIALLLLTPGYLTNRVSLCEMGALSALAGDMIPLLVPPLEQKHVEEFFVPSQLYKLDNTDDLNKLVTRLQSSLGRGEVNLPLWAMEKKKFLSALPQLTKK